MERFEADTVVIGAGVVGLACAAALARAGAEVLVLEAEGAIGSGVSSRNSEVIHAGIYYPPGSQKARRCVEGRELLYAYCAARGVGHRRCGKLIVAVGAAEEAALAAAAARAAENGAPIEAISGDEARRLEPGLSPGVTAALHSPTTGIIDSHSLMIALRGELEDAGGVIAFRAPVTGAEPLAQGAALTVGGDAPAIIAARRVVNAAGLFAAPLARLLWEKGAPPRPYYAKGVYFKYGGRHPFERLIYPTPVDGGLGVHLTFDLGGEARFGPDVEWLDTDDPYTLDYNVDPARMAGFAEAVAKYWPRIDAARLAPDYAGVRPKLSGPGAPAADFMLAGEETHGLPGVAHLLGVESPGLTASLSIAAEVERMLRD